MHLDPRRLAVLRAVADAGGVLAAAPALHLTPSAVSQQIARLETETGLTLLDRSRLGGRRTVGLTAAGQVLAEHAARLAAVLAEAEHDLAALTGQATGPVRVAAFPTAIAHLVAPAAVSVLATAKHVRVHISERDQEPALAALRAGALDLVISESDTADPPVVLPGLRATALLDDPYQVAIPSIWAPVAGVATLLTRPWVDGPAGSATRRVLDRFAARYGVDLVRDHECLEFPAALSIVATGLAAAVVPILALPVPDHPDIVLLDAPQIGARRIDLWHRAGRHEPSPAARLVLDAIRGHAVTRVDLFGGVPAGRPNHR